MKVRQIGSTVGVEVGKLSEVDVVLVLPGEEIVLQYRNYESPSIDVCLPQVTSVHCWGDDDMSPAMPSEVEGNRSEHIRQSKQICIDLLPTWGTEPTQFILTIHDDMPVADRNQLWRLVAGGHPKTVLHGKIADHQWVVKPDDTIIGEEFQEEINYLKEQIKQNSIWSRWVTLHSAAPCDDHNGG